MSFDPAVSADRRLPALDVLRGSAILCMLIAHGMPFLWPTGVSRPLEVVLGAINAVASPLFGLAMGSAAALVWARPAMSGAWPRRVLTDIVRGVVLFALGMLLGRRDHKVTTASTVTEARELAKIHRFDLVISDIGLPDASGHDLMMELRERFQLRGIALSGYGTESDIEKGRSVGFVAHLTKPVNVQALDATLSAVLHPEFS